MVATEASCAHVGVTVSLLFRPFRAPLLHLYRWNRFMFLKIRVFFSSFSLCRRSHAQVKEERSATCPFSIISPFCWETNTSAPLPSLFCFGSLCTGSVFQAASQATSDVLTHLQNPLQCFSLFVHDVHLGFNVFIFLSHMFSALDRCWMLCFGCYGEVTGITAYQTCWCACVDAWHCACMCFWLQMSIYLRAFSSNASRGPLELMGPPVASLLIVLHPSPLGCVLAVHPRSSCSLRARHGALTLWKVLRFLIVLQGLGVQHTWVFLTFLSVLDACRASSCLSSSLRPLLARRRTALLFLSSGGQRSRPAGAVGFALVVAVGSLYPLLFSLLFPNSVAKLLHAVQLRMVEERQEVPVPHPVLGWVTRASSCCPGKSR